MSLVHGNARAALCMLLFVGAACDDAPSGDSADIIPDLDTPAQGSPPGGQQGVGAGDADAGPATMPTDGAAAPPAFQVPTSGSLCSVKVGAECDGDEDCDGGEVCCGRFDSSPTNFGYTSIACSATCAPTDFQLCHPGDDCPGDTLGCRASLVLPYDFVGVCAQPAEAPELTGEAIEGEVLCGERTCVVGEEKCCYRARFQWADRATVPLEPYCAPLDHECDCDGEPAGGGDLDAGGEEDAG